MPRTSKSKSKLKLRAISTSRKSESDSRRRKPSSLRRSRPLRRKVSLTQTAWVEGDDLVANNDHIKYAYAAYKKGAFDRVTDMPEGLTPQGFKRWAMEVFAVILERRGEVITALDDEGNPAALVMVDFSQGEGKPFAFPHAIWFPWASPRDKLALGIHFFIELKKRCLGLVTARGADVKFFEHLSKYGVVRPVGWVHDFYGPGQRAKMFQTVGN